MKIPELKKLITAANKWVELAESELSKAYMERDDLVKDFQGACPHPESFLDEKITEADEPLACPSYRLECTACGKVVEEGDIIQGRRILT